MTPPFDDLMAQIRACTLCAGQLPQAPRPVLQVSPEARILIVGQAPGRRAHGSGCPFDDPSGDRLRQWMGLSREQFYDPARVAIVPIGFCYPGRGRAGDLPPRPECAPRWQAALFAHLQQVELTLLLGRHAQRSLMPTAHRNLTEQVRDWSREWPRRVSLPHPSPRNNLWLRRNPWFEQQLLPALRQRVADIL